MSNSQIAATVTDSHRSFPEVAFLLNENESSVEYYRPKVEEYFRVTEWLNAHAFIADDGGTYDISFCPVH